MSTLFVTFFHSLRLSRGHISKNDPGFWGIVDTDDTQRMGRDIGRIQNAFNVSVINLS